MAKKKNLTERDMDAQRQLAQLSESLQEIYKKLADVCTELRDTQQLLKGNVKRRKVLRKRHEQG